MDASERENLDEFSDQTVLSLGILARGLRVKNAELQPTLDAIVSTAVSMINHARDAGLIIVARGELIPQATTGQPPQALDRLQQKTGDGPCINAAQQQAVVRVDDIRRDTRWPGFSAEAASLGVGSMLCVPLWINERCLGTLSLYAERASAFTDHDERITTVLGTLAALVLAEAQQADQLHTALGNRDVIGQAKGILMERHHLTADAAFRCLSRASQAENMKLTAVAQHLVDTGELLGTPRPGEATPRP